MSETAGPVVITNSMPVLRVVLALAVVGGPLGYLVGGALSPEVHADGQTTVAANVAASPVSNGIHLTRFVIASFLLPLSAFGLAYLAYPRSQRLAMIGGVVGVIGWLPFSALAALDDLAAVLATLSPSDNPAVVYDRFSTDPIETIYLIVYVIGHLAGYVVLGVALLKSDAIPRWAAWLLIVSTPLTIAVFVIPGRPLILGDVALSLIVTGSVPAALQLARPNRTCPGSEESQ